MHERNHEVDDMKKILTIVAEVTLEDDFQEELQEYILNGLKNAVECQFSDADGDRDCKITKLEFN